VRDVFVGALLEVVLGAASATSEKRAAAEEWLKQPDAQRAVPRAAAEEWLKQPDTQRAVPRAAAEEWLKQPDTQRAVPHDKWITTVLLSREMGCVKPDQTPENSEPLSAGLIAKLSEAFLADMRVSESSTPSMSGSATQHTPKSRKTQGDDLQQTAETAARRYIADKLGIELQQFTFGQSNPTYFLRLQLPSSFYSVFRVGRSNGSASSTTGAASNFGEGRCANLLEVATSKKSRLMRLQSIAEALALALLQCGAEKGTNVRELVFDGDHLEAAKSTCRTQVSFRPQIRSPFFV